MRIIPSGIAFSLAFFAILALSQCTKEDSNPHEAAADNVPMGGMAEDAAKDWFIHWPDLELDLPQEAYQDGDYDIILERYVDNPTEERLLKLAESVYAATDIVLQAAEEAHFKDDIRDATGPYWWTSRFDGVRLPYSITGRAIDYYLGLIKEFEEGDFTRTNGITMKKAELFYMARVEQEDSYRYKGRLLKDVYVVRMELRWSNYCGGECALYSKKERIILFNIHGNVIGVTGDGNTPARAS